MLIGGYRQETYKGKEVYKQLAKDLESGMGPKQALLRAGYPMNAARKGMAKIPKAALLLIDKDKRDALIALGIDQRRRSGSPGPRDVHPGSSPGQ
jgi:hypothetical protein